MHHAGQRSVPLVLVGTNAHVVLEEYIQEGSRDVEGRSAPWDRFGSPVASMARLRVQGSHSASGGSPAKRDSGLGNDDSCLIVLSAKNEDRLNEVVNNLYEFIKSQISNHKTCRGKAYGEDGSQIINFNDLAYTLQVGREAMEERLAIFVEGKEDLVEKLSGILEGKQGLKKTYYGKIKENEGKNRVLANDEDSRQMIEKWIEKRKLSELGKFWVDGLEVDWNKLYGESKPCRITLPTYPFAKDRYWIVEPSTTNQPSAIGHQPSARLHPLVHENMSNFEEQRLSSTFTGDEFFLADHVVKGQKVLPGVAYLEMAREAVKQATGGYSSGSQCLHLKKVVWARPIAVGADPQEVKVGLFPEENGEIAYEIYTTHPVDGKVEIRNQKHETQSRDEIVVNSQGVATFAPSGKMPSLNLADLQAGLNEHYLSSEACYEAFKKMGIEYGPTHKGLEKIYAGGNEVLAKLTLPTCISGTKDQFILHPSLLVSALQASIA